MAEHTWALILACAKGVAQLNDRMHDGHWDKATHKSLELKGRTLGLVGLGAIGRRAAQVGVAMGMRVIAFDPFASDVPGGVEVTSLDAVIEGAHVLSLHCPLTPENRGMINADTIGRMRDGAILVNTARGGSSTSLRSSRPSLPASSGRRASTASRPNLSLVSTRSGASPMSS